MELLRLARKSPMTVTPEATVFEAIQVMVDQRVGAVAVTVDDKLVGIFSERDVMIRIVHKGIDPKGLTVADVMTSDVKTVPASTSISEATHVMAEYRIRHLPVIDDAGKLLGMVSLRYLLHDKLDDLLNDLASLNAYMEADGPGG